MAATLKDIAQVVGVSVTTVSRALAGYSDVAETTRQQIQTVANDLGYHPNIIARRLQKKRTDTLGFIMPTRGPRFADPFFSDLIAGIGNEAAIHDYDLLVSTHSPESEGELRAYEKAARGRWVDGLIIARTRENDSRIQLLCQQEFPFVAFGRTDDELEFPFVDEDSEAGMRLMVQHFIDLGHRHIAYIAPPSGLTFGRYRKRGFLEAMAHNGIRSEPGMVVEGDLTQRGGARVMEQLLALDPRPTAVIGGNDLMAIGAMSVIQQQGLIVGKDISVGGFDDVPTAAYTNPPLTTLHQPIYDIGRMTCAMLIEIVNGRSPDDTSVLLTPSLIVRASSGNPVI